MDVWIDFLTDEELLLFLRRKKTELSCMERPHVFLRQLRDHELVKEDIYKKVVTMENPEPEKLHKYVYDILEQLEKENPRKVRRFWKCVLKEPILQRYPTLREIKSLMKDYGNSKKKPNNAEPEAKKISEGKETEKRKAEDDPGPSSAVKKKSATKLSFSPPKKGDQQDNWKWSMYKNKLPVTCERKKGILHRDKLAEGQRRPCIWSEKRWFTPGQFEKFGGKEGSKNWKSSIYYRTKTLKSLIEEGHLLCPAPRRRTREPGNQGEPGNLHLKCDILTFSF